MELIIICAIIGAIIGGLYGGVFTKPDTREPLVDNGGETICYTCNRVAVEGLGFSEVKVYHNKIFTICKDCRDYLSQKYDIEISWYGDKTITDENFQFIDSIKNKISKEMNKKEPCNHCGSKNNLMQKRICDECSYEFCWYCDAPDYYDGCPACSKKTYWDPIINLLKDKSKKMSISDIAAFIDEDRDCVKEQLEFMYKAKMINFAGNGRYFILSDNKKAAKTTSKKSDTTDVKTELKKFKEMLDDGLIEQEDYDAKKNELLGL
tara:strand:- start:49 stop:840 length:792 start_codon:yes stop_codon:yes gene_type:complete